MKYFDGVHQEPCTKDIYASRHYIMTSSGVDVDERILLTQLNQRGVGGVVRLIVESSCIQMPCIDVESLSMLMQFPSAAIQNNSVHL